MLIEDGNNIYVVTSGNLIKSGKLPNKNYIVQYSESRGYFLTKTKEFKMPLVMYGNPMEQATLVKERFSAHKKNLGVLLSGLKGSGKTLLSKLICQEVGLPVLIIESKMEGAGLSTFLNAFDQELVVFVDELEKIYDIESQEQFLSILDGVFATKKLFIFTTNTKQINEFLRTRPSRIHYHFDFSMVEEVLIDEVIADLLEDQSYKAELKEIINVLSYVSYDSLISLIEEINFTKKSPKECLFTMNISVENRDFDVWASIDGKVYNTKIGYNPLISKYLQFSYESKEKGWGYFREEVSQMEYTVDERVYEFVTRSGNKIKCTPTISEEEGFRRALNS